MRAKRAALVVIVGLLMAAMPVLAHHSFKAQYDENQPITLNGTVTKLIWKNPHVILDVDVKGGTGEVTRWELELDSPNALMSQGWKVDSFKAGDHVIVTGSRAKNGSNLARAKKVTLAAP
jgi:Family of unknown function (DUF6152)